MRRLWKILSVLAVLTVAVVVAGIVALQSIDFNQYKGVVAEEVKKATGRELTIKGDFKLDVGFDIILAAQNVSLANAEWGTRPDMLQVKQINVDLKVLPLVIGAFQIDRLVLIGADALLETDSKGRGNWEFNAAAPEKDQGNLSSERIPTFQEVDIQGLKIVYRDGMTGVTTTTTVDELSLLAKDGRSPLDFRLAATHNGMKYGGSGTLGSVNSVLAGEAPFPVNARGTVAGASVQMKGTIERPRDFKGINLDVTVSGKNLEETIRTLRGKIMALRDVREPPFGRFRLSGRLTGSADRLGLTALDASLGDSGGLSLSLQGTIGDIMALQDLNVRLTAAGDEFAEVIRLARVYVPQLKDIEPSPIGPFSISAQARGSAKALALSGIDAKIGRTSTMYLKAQGKIADAVALKGVDIASSLEGDTLEPLEKLIGTAMPKLPPYNVNVHVRHQKEEMIHDLDARIGVSTLKGRIAVKLDGAKPSINGQLSSERIDFDEMFPPSNVPQPPKERSVGRTPPKLFPDEPFSLQAFRDVDARAELKVGRLRYRGNLVTGLEGSAALKDGKLTVDHVFATVENGHFVGKLVFDAGTDKPSLIAKTDIRDLPLGALLKKSDIADNIRLTVDAEIDIKGQGGSPHAIADGLSGHAKVVGRDGHIDSRFLSGAVKGVTDIIPWFRHEDANKINCFVGRYDIKDGVARSTIMLLDTPGMAIKGSGQVDLGKEVLDMTFVPKAKKTSLASLALPMTFEGPLTEPRATTNVSAETIRTVTNVVTTVGSVLLGPVGLLGSLGYKAVTGNKGEDACVNAMKEYSSLGQAPKNAGAPAPSESAATPPPKKEGTVQGGVDRAGEAAGEVVKGVGNAIKGLFGSDKK